MTRKPKTHCSRGHKFTPENTMLRKKGESTFRRCRTCFLAELKDYKRRKPEQRQRPVYTVDQSRAMAIVSKRKARGTLIPGPCRDCGTTENIHGHHHRGYAGAAALDVIWLCARHHQREHRAVLAATDPEAEG